MDVATGALPNVLLKLDQLLKIEYNLPRDVKREIVCLQAELESLQIGLLKISETSAGQPDNQQKTWAMDVRELSYDIEDRIDTFMLHSKSSEPILSKLFMKFTRSPAKLMPTKIIATEIRELRSRVKNLEKLRWRYRIDSVVAKSVTAVDPRMLSLYERTEDLVGIDEPRDELIKILMKKGQVSEQQGKIVSIVGSAGLGKTTLANEVYVQLRAQFDCCAFVSASREPDLKILFEDMLYEFDKNQYASIHGKLLDERMLIVLLREFLHDKRYFIVIDDIWEISVWNIVRLAFPDNNNGHRIITTTRILDIAHCIGGSYIMKPLSLDNSRILLYRRIFPDHDEANCLDEELAEVSDKMLKKCAGLPLAIITIASVLSSKGRNKMEWNSVYNSIGTGLEYSVDVDNMRKILSFSYYDLPSHLKTCLLYLSMFPEDYEIDKDLLVKMWIAEGLIHCRNEQESMFQLGDSYFNELINRRLIQPMDGWNNAIVQHCHIHDMVLDLIRSLSNEEDFVTVVNDLHQTSPSEKIRRLSLQKSIGYYARPVATTSMEQVRSVALFPSAVNLMPPLSSFRAVRVLHLENSCISEGYSLKDLINLYHLRYLTLRDTGLAQLPEEIGSLQFLQTLDIRGTGISILPSTVVHLKHLMFLNIESWTRVPSGIGNLTSLQELSTLGIDNFTDNIMEELGCLTELRVLGIDFNSLEKSLVECLNKLQKIESLYISVFGECNLDGWDTPRCLRRLEISGCFSSTLSTWMKQPLLLQDLSSVSIEFRKLYQDDLDLLGMLPALRFLDLEMDHEDHKILERFVIGARFFPLLAHCVLRGTIGPVEFQQEAMPRLTRLFLTFPVRVMRETSGCNGGFSLGLENLKSLQDVTISFLYGGAGDGVDAVKAEAALRHAIEIHSNHPTLQIRL